MSSLKKYFFDTVVSILFGLGSLAMFAQDIPPVSVFTADIYGADSQNWSVTQTNDRTMFFANSKGLLKYDGERWELLGSINNTILRSVHAKGNDIYTGAYMEFGVWKLDDNNQYKYHSLSRDLDLVEDEQFWNITTFDSNYIVFQSLDAIYIYNIQSKEFKILRAETEFTKMVIKNNVLYYHEKRKGLFKLLNGTNVPINTTDLLKSSILINLYTINNELYVQTQNNGIINVNNNEQYILNKSDNLFSEISVYSSIQKDNGDIYLGTISNGLIVISDGEIVQELNQENALSNNTVLNLFIDLNNNIWLTLDNGINSINVDSNISIFNDQDGKLGTVYDSIKFEDNLYLGTNQGLFIFDLQENNYRLIKGTKGQVWSLFSYDNTLFCGHHNGTYIIEKDKAELLENNQGTWTFQVVDSTTIMTGNYEGLNLYKKSNSKWVHYKKIKGFDISTKYFEFVDTTTILINHEYKGVFKLILSNDLTEVVSVEKDSSVNKGLYSSIIKLRDKVFYADENGIFHYDKENSRFIKDSVLTSFFMPDNYSSGRIDKTENDKIWVFSKTDIICISLGSVKDEYIIRKIPISAELRNQLSGYENVSLVNQDTYLIGKNNGYLKLKNPESIEVKPVIYLNDLSVFSLNDKYKKFPIDKGSSEFKSKFNNLSFKVTSYNYNPLLKTEYQHKLIGYDDDWSAWEDEGNVLYKNLPFGNYTFQSRSRIGQSKISDVVSYQFSIGRPFYLSNIMIVFYVLLLLLLALGIHLVNKNNYNRKKIKLQKDTERKLEIKTLENQKEIMRINNEKLKNEVENKNRELAISTMSLVKKSEFLSKIKSELKPIQGDNRIVKNVVKTINKNLNSKSDWEFFEEAFNNADKDFFKKLKLKHSKLTPNELKLCAYLRLNLSSKEIAPLFNISPKSVEIKRYRLRKKMDLDRNVSLTNYILSI
jgi:DNA-binding CsgD family transcriptional regulator/ligand-binding sensor domain-containing protein